MLTEDPASCEEQFLRSSNGLATLQEGLATRTHQCWCAVGCLVYHGPREQVVPFFESLGFKLPPRKGTADFLQEITSQKDQAVSSGTLHASTWLIPASSHLPCPYPLHLSQIEVCAMASCRLCGADVQKLNLVLLVPLHLPQARAV